MTKILLVEDDKSLREIYGVRLLAEGYEIVSAGDGEEALAIAIKERPNLIISDVMMPKISGFDMLDILRSTTETKDIKVIMMTALSSEDQRARGESLGADRYLVKSQVGIEDVVRTVHDVMSDGVASPQSAAQTFGAAPVPSPEAPEPAAELASTPAPSDIPTPVAPADAPILEPTVVPPVPSFQAPAEDVPAPVAPAPAESVSMPEPAVVTPAPTIPPIINIPPEVPAAFQPAPNPLPQPTAPFSSNRPDSLGDRIIHPLSEAPAPVDMGSLMNQELNNSESQAETADVTPDATPAAAPTDTPQA